MLQEHIDKFKEVARDLNCHILLREPNPLSAKWFREPKHAAKGLDCSAKTADNPEFKYAGLVTNPITRPEAFMRGSLVRAEESWRKAFPNGVLPGGWTCVEDGEEKGLLKNLDGCFLFADYDLMAVWEGRDIFGKQKKGVELRPFEETALFKAVQYQLNKKLGLKLIMHGPEMNFPAVGCKDGECLYRFDPDGTLASATTMRVPTGKTREEKRTTWN